MNLQGQSRELIPFALSVQETCGLLEEDGMLMQCSVLFYSDLYDLVKCASGQQHEKELHPSTKFKEPLLDV